jgi:C4-type Zn-finger protein
LRFIARLAESCWPKPRIPRWNEYRAHLWRWANAAYERKENAVANEINLEEQLTRVVAKINKLNGRRELLMAQLQDEFGYSTIEEATAALEQLEEDYEREKERYRTLYDRFHADFADRLDH